MENKNFKKLMESSNNVFCQISGMRKLNESSNKENDQEYIKKLCIDIINKNISVIIKNCSEKSDDSVIIKELTNTFKDNWDIETAENWGYSQFNFLINFCIGDIIITPVIHEIIEKQYDIDYLNQYEEYFMLHNEIAPIVYMKIIDSLFKNVVFRGKILKIMMKEITM